MNDMNVTKSSWLPLLILSLAACDGAMANGDAGRDGSSGSTRATVSGRVTYEGTEDGSILVGIFDWDEASPSMPMGPPLEFVPANDPTFPFEYELRGLRPGGYFVGAVLDVGRDNPTIPGEEDLEVYTGRIDLAPGDALTVDLELLDE